MVYLTEMHKITILQMIGYGDRTRKQAEVVRLFQEKYPELPPISQGTKWQEINMGFFELIKRSLRDERMRIILLEKCVFELLTIWKNMGFHHFNNGTLDVHIASLEHQMRPTSVLNSTP
ncbi:hypothetical protein NQ318_000590 [Aromia moschata]|uniref:Uncharacterized protein n=1 Tax=Aromia moschata TaxID=1265417 RepID=A0AAV8XSD8_9CUCU|nr:hypothetical protein NQ318_000590 [Aromia moschata]